jgi:hypothetical protein
VRANGAALIALLLLQACFFEPSRPSNGPSDGATGSGDGQGSNTAGPTARLIQHAWYCNGASSDNMQQSGYWITTSGITDGDLVLFIANMDNGDNNVFALPPGFMKLYEVFYDLSGDGQTFAVGYKIIDHASGEGSSYSNPYSTGNLHSGCAVISLIGVTGYDPANPFNDKTMSESNTGISPIVMQGELTTTRANTRLILAGGADWFTSSSSGDVTFEKPANFDFLDTVTDSGGISVVWASQAIATRLAPTPGATGIEQLRMMSSPNFLGAPWAVELAIAPAP